MTATTTTARIDPQTQEELMRQAGIWIEHSTLIEDDLPARPLAAVQAEKHQLDRYTQLVADRAAARDSKCLAQIEEPAGAAPAAVAPRARDLLGIVRTAQAEARRLINGEDSGSDLAQTKLDLPETLRVLEHALSQPAAVAGPASRKVFLVATGETSDGAETYTRHEDAPPPMCDAECLYTAPAAPALEAPAAPAGWKLVPAKPTDAMLGAAQKAWLADPLRRSSTLYVAALAAAPQAPAAPSTWAGPVRELMGHLSDVLGDEAFAKIDTTRWNAVSALIGGAPAAPAAPTVDAPPLDVCTDPYNCARRKAHPNHRKGLEHAGISRPRSAAQAKEGGESA